ncbi:agmatinase [Candidatus Pacearchaeota archaeon]|uniref:Agmatinase n=1 Tax=Candidatus Staskawiczbacteria bacterium RIFCSPHIGHO2_01_FULL_36_16 TaxID=1802200 RepID=A0A1G2HPK7_9BACT|nr:agmatinase [Candidatus Pacearchaeota archaeon]OGZ64383.1 MAG: agmatinase [Candidatus Staskawiczbacteria bacterium RIFCSPHIGHO2_01_FULL_36_16]
MKQYNNFLNIPPEYSAFEKSKAVVIPFEYEASTTYGSGTKRGPEAIISASSQVELFDEELEKEAYKEAGVCTIPELKYKTGHDFYLPLADKTAEILALKKFPVILGGEHTITFGGIMGAKEKYKNFSVLHFDAHADLRDTYEDNKFSHACVMRRVSELKEVKNLVQVGIRNISNEKKEGSEFDFYKKNSDKIKIFWARDKEKWDMENILQGLKKDVYLTFDVDVFDPSIMPSTGTPEPGGLYWNEVLKILKQVFLKKNIIAADIVELCPIKDFSAPDFMIAKLIYKIIGYKFLLGKEKHV